MTKLEKNNILKTNLHMEKVTSNKPLIFFSYAIKKKQYTPAIPTTKKTAPFYTFLEY